MSDLAKKIKIYYVKGLYTEEQVKAFFDRGKITKEEYEHILESEEILNAR